jgi:ADP-heptose:LPS heptosyltransferase
VRERPLLVALRPLGLGDFLTGVPALRALADAFPSHRRVLAAPAPLAPLASLSGAVDALAPTEPLTALAPQLHSAEVTVDLHGRGPASHRVLLASRPGRLIAFANTEVPESRGMPDWRPDEHEVTRWCRMLEGHGIPADASRLELDPPDLGAFVRERGATNVHPGAASAARRWPADRFAAVARSERELRRRVIITGSAAEVQLARSVAIEAGLDTSSVYAGRTDLLELAELVAFAGRVVCGDTGVGHLATAFGTPSVILFGPTSPERWGPPPALRRHRPLWSGSKGDPHASRADPGLLTIRVDDVLTELAALESEVRAAPDAACV